ncbi:MAG: hypothetical protein ACP5KN_15995 [Armatimonadota bacterium]
MRILPAVPIALIMGHLPAAAQLSPELFTVGHDWTQPAAVTRHTSLLATFDGRELAAEHARGMALGDTYHGRLIDDGRWGGALELTERASVAHFRGDANINPRQGTIELWVRSAPGTNIWGDGEEHWLFDGVAFTTRGRPTIGLFKRPEDDALVLFQADWWQRNRKEYDLDDALVYDAGELDPQAWHHLLASWHAPTGRLWLAVDGRGVTATKAEPFPEEPFTTLWLGSSGSSTESFYPLGGLIDHLRVSDVPATGLERSAEPHEAVDLKLLAAAEDSLRRWFDFLERVQAGGHWANCYTWPTLLPSPTGAREWIRPTGYISNDKGHVGPAACRMIYGSQILEDPWYLHVARRMADAYVDAQMPQGCWGMAYYARPEGLLRVTEYLTPIEGGKVKLQDQNQVHPLYLLVYMHRLTGDQRYYDAAIRAGQFLRQAQNPNGSWSHYYDLDAKQGVQVSGAVGGGELNDLAVNDGMDAMLLMYHLTDEQEYLDAFVRCAEWLLEAQLGPPTYGWAMQYDAQNQPVWARPFEPPSTALGGGAVALRALTQAYHVTGERRYVEAPRRYFEWLQTAAVDGQYYSWYDHRTGEPIVADHRRIYRITDEDEMREMLAGSVRLSYTKPRSYDPGAYLEQIDETLQSEWPPAWAPAPDLAQIARELPALAEHVRGVIESQNEAGVGVARGQGELRAAGSVVWTNKSRRVGSLLQYVEHARMLLGELPAEYRGRPPIDLWAGDALLRCAYPVDDWYQTPLRNG